ncbi:paraquat-inducible protein A [Celeribacter halophilus]|uniref:Paraquat-inducible protein A n=1 Tax=Celeribacter halophilus TaxID=576117 RepID=A0A1I3N7R4_9RHOB|nr:paraquat-inducible protein A [Celeribacter halophilus]PZX15686.1 paraquat-inducible protein A [Celeribacter halophilus]SFJ05294.1 Paraquat-inducible protein A [Celeribacter halophilus]
MTLPRLANLSLLLLFPLAWVAPLLKAGVLPLFALSEISVLSGIGALWEKDKFLALVVTFFAMIAPIGKVLALEGLLSGRLPARIKPWLYHLGRLAMADVFLIAIYITAAKGIGIGRIEIGWGLYLFTFCVLLSLGLSIFAIRKPKESLPHPPSTD